MKKVVCVLMLSLAALFCQKPAPADYVVEIATVKAKPGVSENQMKTGLNILNEFAEAQPGFLGREFGLSDDGSWVDVVRWADMKAAKAAAEKAMSSKICGPVFQLFDEKSISMSHVNIVGRAGS